MLSKLTLIVPTFNRQDYALRNMRYWSNLRPVVHVLDGSQVAIPESKLVNFGDNIHYHHLPFSVTERLKLGVDLVATEYSMLLGDDEFFIPSALEACIKELEEHPGLVSCMGRCLGFNNSPNGVLGWPAYLEMENYAILQDDPIQRMVAHMNPYTCSTIYSVVRTPVWKKAASTFRQREFEPFNLGEIQFELAVCYQGKSRIIPTLAWLRSFENIPIRDLDLTPRDRNYLIEGWWLNPNKKSEHNDFLKIMSDALAGSEDQVGEVVAGLVNSIDVYVQERLGLLSTMDRMRARISPCLLEFLKRTRRALRDRFSPLNKSANLKPPLSLAAYNLANQGVRVDFEELAAIESTIFAFHRGL
jgi:glycosyltransferase domain-containing protein